MRDFSFFSLFLLILCVLLLLCVKIYVFSIVLPVILVFFFRQQKRRFIFLKYIAATVLLGGLYWLSHLYFPQKQIDAVHSVKVQNQWLYNMMLENGDTATFTAPLLDGSTESLVKNAPQAMYNALTQPLTRPDRFWKFCADAETILLLLLLFVCLIFGNYKRFFQNNFALFCVFVSIYGFLLIGLTTHEMVMMMRFKAVYLPFYVFGLVHLLDTERVASVFKFRKRRKKQDFDIVKSFEERMANMSRGR
jgi:hypothetical protein